MAKPHVLSSREMREIRAMACEGLQGKKPGACFQVVIQVPQPQSVVFRARRAAPRFQVRELVFFFVQTLDGPALMEIKGDVVLPEDRTCPRSDIVLFPSCSACPWPQVPAYGGGAVLGGKQLSTVPACRASSSPGPGAHSSQAKPTD